MNSLCCTATEQVTATTCLHDVTKQHNKPSDLAININRKKMIATLSHVVLVLLWPDTSRAAVVWYQQSATRFQPTLQCTINQHFYHNWNTLSLSFTQAVGTLAPTLKHSSGNAGSQHFNILGISLRGLTLTNYAS